MGRRAVLVVLAVTCVVLAGAMPPTTRITESRNKRGVKGSTRNEDSRTTNGCKTYADGAYECRHSYGYGDADPFKTGGSLDPNTISSSLNTRDFGRDLVQAHVAGFDGDKNGCKTYPDGSYECRRGYSYSSSTHGWNALQNDPLSSSSLLNLHAVNQDLAALRDGTASFDRNQNGCRTFPDGSWECKRSWGYGSSDTQTVLNAAALGRGSDIGQDDVDVRGGTGTIGRDDNGCRTFKDGSWECRRGYSYSAATGWNLVSGDTPAPVSERRSSYNTQSATQNVHVNRNGGFDTTQKGCRTYADGSWECQPQWGYRPAGDTQSTGTVPNTRERDNIRDTDRNTGSRTYSSTQERQEVFSNSGSVQAPITVSNPRERENIRDADRNTGSRTYSTTQQRQEVFSNSGIVQTPVSVPNPRERENIRDNDRNTGSRTYSTTQERQEIFSNNEGSTPNVGSPSPLRGQEHVPVSQDARVNPVGDNPTGCTTLSDGSVECRRGYSYSSRQERNYTRGGILNGAQPSNREVARPRDRPESAGVNSGRSSYSLTQERESIRNGGIDNLDTQVRENVADSQNSQNILVQSPVRLSYAPQVNNEPITPSLDNQRPVNPTGNVARHEYSYTHERESVRNGGDISPVDSPTVGLHSNPRENIPESHSNTVTTPRPSSYSGAVVNSQNRGRVYQEPKLGTVSRTSYSQTQQREVVNNAARPNSSPITDGVITHGNEDFSDVSNVRLVPSYTRPATSPQNPDRDYRTPVVDSGVSGTRSYSYTQEKEVVNHGGVVNPSASRTVGLNTQLASDLRGTTGGLGASGCQTNPDGSTVCRRGYSHSSTQEREIYSGGSGGRSSDIILDHEEPGMVTVVTNPNARPNKEGCRTLPDGGTECVRGHSETRQWGHGASAGAPIVNPFRGDGSLNILGGSESLINTHTNEDLNRRTSGGNSGNTQGCTILPDGRQQCRQGYSYSATEERQTVNSGLTPLRDTRITNNHGGREVEGVKTGRRTSSYSSSSQSHRIGGVTSPSSQNSGRYLSADGNLRQSAALQQGSSHLQVGGAGNIAEVHNEEYSKSGSSGRGSGCAQVAGSPCSRNGGQQSGYSYSSYGSTGFRTGTLEV